MHSVSTAAALVLVAGLTMSSSTTLTGAQTGARGGEERIVTPDQLDWQPAAALPPGARIAVLEGDPSQEGEYFALRLAFPDGYEVPPHWHPVPERVTVLAGTFHLGMGEALDREATEALPPGSFFTMPAEMRHFAWTEGETVLQLNSIGPFELNYVNPEDDPRTARTR